MSDNFTTKEKRVLKAMSKKLKVPKRKTKRKTVVGLVGLVGAGKSSVAEVIAKEIGAVVIASDDIRVELRKRKERFDKASKIGRELAREVLEKDGNVVLDTDHAIRKKQQAAKKAAKDGGAQVRFVRVTCDPDIMTGRIINAKYGSRTKEFFIASATEWNGKRGAAVDKLREMWRRTPHHYAWSMDGGGQWVLKTLRGIFDTVDTSKAKQWKKAARKIAKQL